MLLFLPVVNKQHIREGLMLTSETERRYADFAFGAIGVTGILLIGTAHCVFGFTPKTLTPYPVSMTIKSVVVLAVLYDGLRPSEHISAIVRFAGYGLCSYVFLGGIGAWL